MSESPVDLVAASAVAWRLDPRYSTVGFRVRHHAVATYRARFADIHASYDPATGQVTGIARTASLVTFDSLKDHLLSHEFFAAHRFPTITFVSTSTDREGSGIRFDGDLTLHGVTRPVSGEGTLAGPVRVTTEDGSSSERVGIEATITIDRRDFGIGYNNRLLDGSWNLGWNVVLEFSLEFSHPTDSDSAERTRQ